MYYIIPWMGYWGMLQGYPPGGQGTPLYGLYTCRYVPQDREWFLEVLDPYIVYPFRLC